MALHATRIGAVALAACLGLTSMTGAQAQQKPQAAPTQQPAAPQAQGGPPPGPTKVDLVGTQTDWTKVCGKDQTNNKEICYTTRDFGPAADQPPVLALAVYEVKGDDTRIIRFLMPVGLMLRPGFRMAFDKGANLCSSGVNDANYCGFEICLPNGCFAETKVKGPGIDNLKKTALLNVSVKNQVNNEVTFALPMQGFAKAFEGAPIDPKVLEEQQKQLQSALEKQAEEKRQQIEQKSGGAAPPAAK